MPRIEHGLTSPWPSGSTEDGSRGCPRAITLATASHLVKPDRHGYLTSQYSSGMPTKTTKKKVDEAHPIVRALRWLLENRPSPSGDKWNPSTLSIAAGLARGHVGLILSGEQTADVRRSTLEKIAKAADVRTEWLMTFQGEPGTHESGIHRIERFPTRLPLLAALRAMAKTDEDRAIIAAIEAESPTEDPGPEYWWSRPSFYKKMMSDI